MNGTEMKKVILFGSRIQLDGIVCDLIRSKKFELVEPLVDITPIKNRFGFIFEVLPDDIDLFVLMCKPEKNDTIAVMVLDD